MYELVSNKRVEEEWCGVVWYLLGRLSRHLLQLAHEE